MAKDNKWHCVDTEIYAGIKETKKCIINKAIKLSVAVHDDGSGVNFSHRLWTTFDNFDTDEKVARPTLVNLSYHLRNADDVYALVKQMSEALGYIKDKSLLFNDYDVNIDISSDDKINISMERKAKSKGNLVKSQREELEIDIDDEDVVREELVVDDD